MGNFRRNLLACVLLLALATTGPDLSVDARVVAKLKIFNNEDVDRPMNLSGNSVGQHFEMPVDNKSAKENEDGWDAKISYPPGFELVNALETEVDVQCVNVINPNTPIVVNQSVPKQSRTTWSLDQIDPNNQHVLYECTFTTPFYDTGARVKRVVWADDTYRTDLPFYCVDCIFKALEDGLYLFNLDFQVFVRVNDWCILPCAK